MTLGKFCHMVKGQKIKSDTWYYHGQILNYNIYIYIYIIIAKYHKKNKV